MFRRVQFRDTGGSGRTARKRAKVQFEQEKNKNKLLIPLNMINRSALDNI